MTPAAPSSVSVKSSSITNINGIIRRATVNDFKEAQQNGIKAGTKIPGGMDNTITYHQTGSKFEEALSEIKAGQKKTHWMWYVLPSGIKGETPCSTFFRLGTDANNDVIGGKKTITIKEYLEDNTLRRNYVMIVKEIYDKMEQMLDSDSGQLPQDNLKDIMSNDPKNLVDYYKLKNSIKMFYTPLKDKLKSIKGDDSNDFIKKMNMLNIILNNIKDPEYKVDDKDKLDDDYLKSLGEEALSPLLHDTADADADADADVGPPGSPVSVDSSESSEMPVPKLKLKTAGKSRILSPDDILTLMLQNINENVFIINGGSFNPPHNGHIKMFESAYNTLVARNLDKDKSTGEDTMGYYGIIVVSTRKYIMTKDVTSSEVLSSQDRIKLCKLACDTYNWDKGSKFNANNMIILDMADSDPKALLLHRVIRILDNSSKYKDNVEERERLKTKHLFYLCGSDFFINRYSDSSRYSIIYVSRKSEEEKIEKKKEEVSKYSINKEYLKIAIDMSESDEYDLSSSLVRENILKLGTGLLDAKRKAYETNIIKSIGLPVYCYLSKLEYLIQKKYYGKQCNTLDASLSEELESVDKVDISKPDGFGADADILNNEDWSDYSIDLLTGELDDIPEKDRNIFIDIQTFSMFNRDTIKNEDTLDRTMDGLIICKTYGKKDINYKGIKSFLIKIYDSGIYYILNDLCYFKLYKIDPKYCFIKDLFSNGKENINLLEGLDLINTDQFNIEYLVNPDPAVDNIKKLSDDREKYLGTIDTDKYTDYDGNNITVEIVDDILGFLYDSEKYSLYLYLIDEKQPIEGKRILVKLYSTIVEEKNDRVEDIVGSLNDELTETIERSKRETGPPVIPKKLKGPKGTVGPVGPKRPKGATELLKAVKYIKQRTNGDGNCFYNSIGMLSSEYLRDKDKDKFDKYEGGNIHEKYKIQYVEQIRVRRELTQFMTNIYQVIKDVDKSSSQYKDSNIIKYIVRYGPTFKYVSIEKSPVGSKYYGTDSEIYFASLYYQRPIVTVTGISDVTVFNVFYWKYYQIGEMNFVDYLKQDESAIDVKAVLNFLYDSNEQLSCELDDISVFLMYYPNSYFLVGGTGHWSYAINMDLFSSKSDDSSVPVTPISRISVGGDYSKLVTHNIRVTKKIKKNDNKYHNKSSSSKTTRKHKITRKGNKNKKRNKKTIKYNR